MAAHVGVGAAGEEHQRLRIDVGGGHADDGVGRARPDGGEGGHGASASAVVAVGHVDGTLLVHGLDDLDAAGVVHKGVEHRSDADRGEDGDDLTIVPHDGFSSYLSAAQIT